MRAYRHGTASAAAALMATAAALLAGCGQLPSASGAARGLSDDGPAARHGAQDGAAGHSAEPGADMVRAVDSADSNNSIRVRFRIESRPMVGSPVKVDVQLTAARGVPINHIHGSFLAGAGLKLQSARSFDIPNLHESWSRELTVVPQTTGVLSLSATILVEQDSGSQARTYSIPLIASDSSS